MVRGDGERGVQKMVALDAGDGKQPKGGGVTNGLQLGAEKPAREFPVTLKIKRKGPEGGPIKARGGIMHGTSGKKAWGPAVFTFQRVTHLGRRGRFALLGSLPRGRNSNWVGFCSNLTEGHLGRAY